MSIDDYSLERHDLDWRAELKPWQWLLPDAIEIRCVNFLGDVFAELMDESIHMLDIGFGTFEPIAKSRDDFRKLLDIEDNANDWLMIPLVDKLLAAGKLLPPGYCYGYRRLPILGGDYTVENMIVVPIAEHYGLSSDIHQQIKDLPDGAQVSIEFTDD